MRTYEFVTVDVFTDRRFGGNPLAVFPDASGLSDTEMQALAAEFNLSETSFVLPPADPANTAEVRIFTPKVELPFAGHPNVGTGWVLARAGRAHGDTLRFEQKAGLVEVTVSRGGDREVAGASVAAPVPLHVGQRFPASLVAACAGLAEQDAKLDRHPPVIAGVGVDFTYLELRDMDALRRARPDLAAFRAFADLHRNLGHALAVHLYVQDAKDPARLHARMFAPLSGILEDPATGSANATLAALLLHLSDAPEAAFHITQGTEMGRPSRLHATARRTPEGIRASVGGGCVPVMRGVVEL